MNEQYFGRRVAQLKELLSTYKYPTPFSIHLKSYFKQNKKLGSRDRKELRNFAYQWFRIGHLFNLDLLEDVKKTDEFYKRIENEDIDSPEIANDLGFSLDKIFPAKDKLSPQFDTDAFYLSHLAQPSVWIRIKQGYQDIVLKELMQAQINFEKIEDRVLKLNPESKIDELNSYKKGLFRIQDLTSQQVGNYYQPKNNEMWWDACAGSGGKSLALDEEAENITLFASDIRQGILENFKLRHKTSSFKDIIVFQADLSLPIEKKLPKLDGIIIDAPCTGSGTWARNPENLVYFNESAIANFHNLQLKIIQNCILFLKPGKKLYYSTCSVYKGENEDVVEKIAETTPLKIVEQKYFEGYHHGAENMFLCIFEKSL